MLKKVESKGRRKEIIPIMTSNIELAWTLAQAAEQQLPHASALLKIMPYLSQKSRDALLYASKRSSRVKYWETFLVAHKQNLLDMEVDYMGEVHPVNDHVRGGYEHFASIVTYCSTITDDL